MKGPAEVTWFFFTWTILILFWGAMRGQRLFNSTKSTLCITQLCHNTNRRQKGAADPAPHHSLLGHSVCWNVGAKCHNFRGWWSWGHVLAPIPMPAVPLAKSRTAPTLPSAFCLCPDQSPAVFMSQSSHFRRGYLQLLNCKADSAKLWFCRDRPGYAQCSPWTLSVAPRRHSLNSAQWHSGALWDIYFWKIWYCQQLSEIVSRLLCLLLKFLSFLRA